MFDYFPVFTENHNCQWHQRSQLLAESQQSQNNKTSIITNIFFFCFLFWGMGSSLSLEYIPIKMYNKIYSNITWILLCMFMPLTGCIFRFIYLIFLLLFSIFFKHLTLLHKIFTWFQNQVFKIYSKNSSYYP